MSDDGGSTGVLRDEYGILPPGDLRRAIVALADDDKTEFLRKLFSYRFETGFLKWQNLWNLIMFASENIEKDYWKAINELENLFEIKKWKVYPSTLEKTRLLAQLQNGEYIIWETNIDIPKHDGNEKISNLSVIKQEYAQILDIAQKVWQDEIINFTIKKSFTDIPLHNSSLEKVFEKADYIIFWPGDLYTSILPNLLVWKNIELIKKSKAKKIYIWNLFTKFWETNGYKLSDFINVFKKYFQEDIFDYIIVQDEKKLDLPSGIIENYKAEWKEFVETDINDKRIIKADLISSGTFLRHDKNKLADVLKKTMTKAIFLDRDGTINELVPWQLFLDNSKQVKLKKWVKEWLEKLKKMWYLLIVITNQTGLSAWYYTIHDVEDINNSIEKQLWFKLDAIYACYHHPDDNCDCRKPKIKNIEKAIEDFDINVKESYFIWDKEKDILAGKNAWCKWTVLISEDKKVDFKTQPDFIVKSILEFADILENKLN